MCRSSKGSESARRCKCDAPEPRRARQNLAYHTKKAMEAVAGQTSTLERPVAALDEDVRSESLARCEEIATSYRKQREDSADILEWVLCGEELNPVNLAKGKAQREAEIRSIGSVLSLKAQELAAVTYAEAQERIEAHERVMEEKYAAYNKASELRKQAHELFMKRREGDTASQRENIRNDYLDKKNAMDKCSFDYFAEVDARKKTAAHLREVFAKAHRDVISLVREKGGDISVESRDTEMSKEFKKEIADVFPKEWIDASNKQSDLFIKSERKRAHYQWDAVQSVRKKVPAMKTMASYDFMPHGEPNPDDIRYLGWTHDTERDEWSGPERVAEYGISRWKVDKNGDKVPVGTGWSYGPIVVERVYDGSVVMENHWVKDVHEWDVTVVSKNPTIRLNGYDKKTGTFDSDFHPIAVHEFSHRVEDVNPYITHMEEAFLMRRTTNEEGVRENLVRYMGRSNEVVREDNFINVYMGREYQGLKYREVLSMGSESVFNGTNGGFLGLGAGYEEKTDHDSINFILGAYATL